MLVLLTFSLYYDKIINNDCGICQLNFHNHSIKRGDRGVCWYYDSSKQHHCALFTILYRTKSVLYGIIISCGVRFLFAKEDFNEKKIWKEKSCVGAGSVD